jgi:Holliday junction resolvase-like predicted endonuclease
MEVQLKMKREMTPYQVGVSAEAFAAALFARAGFHVSVQYGANQPGYDLIVEKDKCSLLISVKGSQDGGWGLTQNHIHNADYHQAVDLWLEKHGEQIVFCFVQFAGTNLMDMPSVFLATSKEVATQLKNSRGGLGDTILHMQKTRKVGKAAGCIENIPEEWVFSKERIDFLFSQVFTKQK